jgi:hypothetical protein
MVPHAYAVRSLSLSVIGHAYEAPALWRKCPGWTWQLYICGILGCVVVSMYDATAIPVMGSATIPADEADQRANGASVWLRTPATTLRLRGSALCAPPPVLPSNHCTSA